MKRWKAIWIALAMWAFFGWIYVITRLLMYPEIAFDEPFIEGIPISFWAMGIGFFILGFIATVGALWDGKHSC